MDQPQPNADPTVGQRPGRWPTVGSALGQHLRLACLLGSPNRSPPPRRCCPFTPGMFWVSFIACARCLNNLQAPARILILSVADPVTCPTQRDRLVIRRDRLVWSSSLTVITGQGTDQSLNFLVYMVYPWEVESLLILDSIHRR